jgi:hypothetical protein
VRHAGRVDIFFPPHALHRSRRPASGTCTLSGIASTSTSADRRCSLDRVQQSLTAARRAASERAAMTKRHP